MTENEIIELPQFADPDFYNEAFLPLNDEIDARFFFLYGGRDTGKSHYVPQRFLKAALVLPYFKGVLVRKQFNTIKESQWATIKDMAEEMNVAQYFEFNKSPLEIRCVTGNRILARGLDDPQKIKSLKDPTHVWFEEADQISEDDWETVSLSMRNSRGTKTEEWFTFNAGSPKHWIVERFFPDPATFEKPDGSHSWVTSTDPDAVILHTTYRDNEWLTEERLSRFLQLKARKPKRYKLHGLGLFGRDLEGALWNDTLLDRQRVREAPELARIEIGVDPAITKKEDSDETGIVVAGRDYSGRLYVLGDYSGKYSPNEWARLVLDIYERYRADTIVFEANQGGDMGPTIIRNVNRMVKIKKVHATRGKKTRAAPVAALYEQGIAFHVGELPVLEEQLTTWDADTAKSPDRLDAMVWALTSLGMPAGRAPDRGI